MRVPSKQKFLWGVAHSAFQVEGSPEDSDWRRWTRESGRVADGSHAELGTDFWNQPQRDLDWVGELGANAFRFSLAWERLEPTPGDFDDNAFERYAKILSDCVGAGVEPIVTLLHFALPGWLADRGGLVAHDFASCFERYANEVQKRLGENIKYLITINEPMVQVSFGYLHGIWPPGLKSDGTKASLAALHLAQAHAQAYTALKSKQPLLQISIAKHWRCFEPKSRWNPVDKVLAKMADEFFNQSFLRALLHRKSSFSALGARPLRFDFPGTGPLIDFLGANYYGRMLVGLSLKPPFVEISENPKAQIKSDLGWEIYPKGLQQVLREWSSIGAGIPIMITENGVADTGDRVRSKFLTDHIEQLLASASELGIQILGYLHWSLTDNFEWSEGQAPRFGLIKVHYPASGLAKDLTFEKRPAFEHYKNLIK